MTRRILRVVALLVGLSSLVTAGWLWAQPIDFHAYSFAPTSDNAFDLGSTAFRFRTGYFGTSVSVGASPTAITQVTVYTPSLTPVATPAAIGTTSQTFTVTGLAVADKVEVIPPVPTSLCPMVSTRVSAANTLQLDFITLTAVACTPAAGTYTVVAIRS